MARPLPLDAGWLARLWHTRTGKWALGGLGVMSLMAVLGYVITPDSTPGAARQHPELPRLPPASQAWVAVVPKPYPPAKPGLAAHWWGGTPAQHVHFVLGTDKTMADAALHMSATAPDSALLKGLMRQMRVHLPTLLLPLSPDHPQAQAWAALTGRPYLRTPRGMHYVDTVGGAQYVTWPELHALARNKLIQRRFFWLGTDGLGRDVLSRLVLGARLSLGLGFLAMLLSTGLGLGLGAVAGYVGGWIDGVIQYFMTVLYALPSMILALALAFVMGRGTGQLVLALALSTWVEMGRLVRTEVMALKVKPLTTAMRALGLPPAQVVMRHLLPQLTATVAVLATTNFIAAVLLEAGLSFLGLGVPPPTPSWGSMIQEGANYLTLPGGFWLVALPGAALTLTVMCLLTLSQLMQNISNPQTAPQHVS